MGSHAGEAVYQAIGKFAYFSSWSENSAIFVGKNMEKIGKIIFKVIYHSKPVNLRSTFGGEVFMADKKEKIM